MAEIGIIMLLFQIGLETTIGDLLESGRKSVIVALGGFVLPFAGCFMLSYYLFSQSQLVSLLIAGTMTATSIGITMRSLSDLGRKDSKEGRIGQFDTRYGSDMHYIFGVVPGLVIPCDRYPRITGWLCNRPRIVATLFTPYWLEVFCKNFANHLEESSSQQ